MVDVEVQKKAGFSLQPEEEHLRVQLESIQQELNAPNLFKVLFRCNHIKYIG